MNKNDKILFEFLYDLEGILNSYQYSLALNKLYTDAQNIFLNKTYSNINIQNEDGNTFLHFAFEQGNHKYINQLLQSGANPYIKNNNNKNAFQVQKKNYDFMSKFWNNYEKDINLYFDIFIKDAKKYHPEFRQTLLDISIEKTSGFNKNSIQYIEKSLKSINLLNNKNIINLLMKSSKFEVSENSFDKKFTYLLKLDKDDSDNNFILETLIDKLLRFRIAPNNLALFIKFIEENSFKYDLSFYKSITNSQLLLNYEIPHYQTIINTLIDKSLKENFDLKYTFEDFTYKKPTILEIFLQYPAVNFYYLNSKITPSNEQKKLLKI